MGGRYVTPLLVAVALATTACGERQTNAPTEPEFVVKSGCNFTNVGSYARNEFGASSAEAGLAGDMKNAGAQTDQATYDGYLILDAIASKYNTLSAPGSTAPNTSNASALTVALLACMNIGGAAIPAVSVIDASLGLTGAYGVPGLGTAPDFAPITSHDGAWTFEPPGPGGSLPTTAWQAMTEVLNTNITDPRIADAFLAYGRPTALANFTNDVPQSAIFDWATVPHAAFDGLVIGQCTAAANFLQHNPVSNGGEVLGFVKPSCYGEIAGITEREPRTFAERLVRFLSPSPAYAALATTGGSGGTSSCRTCLSPFEVIFPGKTLLVPPFQWTKSGYFVNQYFPQIDYQAKTLGGTKFLQAYILVWLEATNNQGAKVLMCNNWDYTDAEGKVSFTKHYLNKAGGYTITTRTAGAFTITPAGGQEITIPTVPPSDPQLSPLINVKNSTSTPPDACPSFKLGDDYTINPDGTVTVIHAPAAPSPNG
jgi:hypothetical protein